MSWNETELKQLKRHQKDFICHRNAGRLRFIRLQWGTFYFFIAKKNKKKQADRKKDPKMYSLMHLW